MNDSGKSGENAAAEYLKHKGYSIEAKNFICRYGEIDIVASDDEYIVFVEVKTRKPNSLVSGAQSVTDNKQLRIKRTAQIYLQSHISGLQPRFDVIEVECENEKYVISNHIENAF